MFKDLDWDELSNIIEQWPQARKLNIEPKRETVVQKQATVQPQPTTNSDLDQKIARIKAIAKKYVGTPEENEIIANLELGAQIKKEQYESEQTLENKEQYEEAVFLLEELKKEIKVLKAAKKTEEDELVKKAEKEAELITKIEVSENELKRLSTSFRDGMVSLGKLIDDKEELALISVASKNLTKTFEHYLINVKNYKFFVEEYNSLGNEHTTEYPELYYSEEEVENLYRKIIVKLHETEKSTDYDAPRTTTALNDVLLLLPSLLKDKTKFASIKNKVDEELKNNQHQPIPTEDELLADKEAFQAMLSQAITEYLAKMKEAVYNAKGLNEVNSGFNQRINEIILSFDQLPREITDEHAKLANELFLNTIEKEYGSDLLEFICAFEVNVRNNIEELANIEYNEENTAEFDAAYKKLMDGIARLKNDSKYRNLGIVISFDNATQKLLVVFGTEKVKDFEECVLPAETLAKLNAKGNVNPTPNPNPTPSTPTPVTPGQSENNDNLETALENYKELLSSLNEQINYINECNANMASLGVFDKLTPDALDTAISIEKTAVSYNSLIMKTRLELSDLRAEIRRNFDVYVTKVPEIRDYPKLSIRFDGELDDFIRQHDTMSVKSEIEQERLEEELKTATPERKAEIEKEIQKLVDFIEAQNSLIGRRLVAESTDHNIDLLAKLAERRSMKNALRAELKKQLQKNPQPEPQPKPQPEPIVVDPAVEAEKEQELIRDLETIYNEWLVAIDNSLSSPIGANVNEDEFNNRINQVIEASTATKKLEIAESEKREFEIKKTALIAKHKEQNFINEIKDLLNKDLEEVLNRARKDPTYLFTLNSGTSLECSAKLQEIANSEEEKYNLINKGAIISELLINHNQELNIIVTNEQLHERANFEKDLNNIMIAIESYEIDDEFENNIKNALSSLRAKYLGLADLNYALFLLNNSVTFTYSYKKYHNGEYINGGYEADLSLMSEAKFIKYNDYKNNKLTPQPQPEPEPEPTPTENEEITAEELKDAVKIVEVFKQKKDDSVKINFVKGVLINQREFSQEKVDAIIAELMNRGVIAYKDEEVYSVLMTIAEYNAKYHNENLIVSPKVTTAPEAEVHDIRVNKKGVLKFKSNKPQIINRLNGKILEADQITLQLVKNGLSIKYSENLRRQLHDLNARLSLVSKENYRRRTSVEVVDKDEPQTLAFKKDFEFDPAAYELQIRAKEEGANTSDLLYKIDLEEVKDEIKPGRRL